MTNYLRNGYRAIAAATLLALSGCGGDEKNKATPEKPQPTYNFEKHDIGTVPGNYSDNSQLTVEDIDGDGDKDIIILHNNGHIHIFENKAKNVTDKTAPSPLEQKVEAEQR